MEDEEEIRCCSPSLFTAPLNPRSAAKEEDECCWMLEPLWSSRLSLRSPPESWAGWKWEKLLPWWCPLAIPLPPSPPDRMGLMEAGDSSPALVAWTFRFNPDEGLLDSGGNGVDSLVQPMDVFGGVGSVEASSPAKWSTLLRNGSKWGLLL